ncbi:MAG: substrate-binding domain-containing protein [Pseudonocardiaceae bacterium]
MCLAIGKLPLPKAPPATITDLHAGVFNNLVPLGLKPAVKQAYDITLNDIGGNSVKLANSIKDHSLIGDLYMSADASVNQTLMGPANGNWVSWFTVFARNEVVLAYDPNNKFAADFQNKPWYQVLKEPGIKLGRYDPNLDPLGYYTLFVAQLAEKYYGIPGLKQQILGADYNPDQNPGEHRPAPRRKHPRRTRSHPTTRLPTRRRSGKPIRLPAQPNPGRRRHQRHTLPHQMRNPGARTRDPDQAPTPGR